jgi:flagellar basal-body rod protein FlgF
MLAGYYSGVSGLYYNQQKLDVVSNNLANADTTGFRRSLMVARSRDMNDKTPWIHSDARDRLPHFYGAERTGVYKIYGDTGKLQATGSPYDVAIAPELKNAFFSVKRSDPTDKETYYSRNGTISIEHLDSSDSNSPSVLYLGGNIALSASGNPIEVNLTGGQISVGLDGVVRQGESALGELGIFRFNKSSDPRVQVNSNLQLLSQLGDSLFKIPEEHSDEFNPRRLDMGRDNLSRLTVQGVRESSNVNPVTEMVGMMEATKSFAANADSIKTQMQGLQKLFQLVQS